jgi:trk system potassium uptake protein TrkH
MRAVLDLPLLVVLIGIGAAAMLVPAAHAAALGDWRIARTFLQAGVLSLVLAALLGLATQASAPRRVARSQLVSLAGAYVVLPVLLAVPFHEAVRTTSFLNAWFEMVSCLTTTGMTVFDDHARLQSTLHLWRGLVGWMGGFFVWVVAIAVLAPMNLGGFEVGSADPVGQGAAPGAPGFRRGEAGGRIAATAAAFLPVYGGLTAALWLCLILAGSTPTTALIHAMATLSTSGISPVGGLSGAGTGLAAEIAVAAFMVFALSRNTWMGLGRRDQAERLRADRELRLGVAIVGGLTLFLFLRHWLGAADVGEETSVALGLRALWGSLFTVLSFLTTTGFVSADWAEARSWSGLTTPGVLLMGLAIFGGGVATTAGGVKLLRIWALYTHAAREMERLVHPSSVGGAGPEARRLRRSGAEIAWVFFMLFAISLSIVTAGLGAVGLDFDKALVLAVAALSTTGPLAMVGLEAPVVVIAQPEGAKAILMAAMVLGRLETLALLALFNPDFWRS